MIKPYGTYQTFSYQTVNLQPMKQLGLGLLKLIAVLFVLAALTVTGVLLFQVVYFVGSAVWSFVAANAWQVACVPCVFFGMWKVKP